MPSDGDDSALHGLHQGLSVAELSVEWRRFPKVGDDPVVEQAKSGSDSHVHVEVLVSTKAPPEQGPVLSGLSSRENPVALQLRPIGGCVDRIIGLVAGLRK